MTRRGSDTSQDIEGKLGILIKCCVRPCALRAQAKRAGRRRPLEAHKVPSSAGGQPHYALGVPSLVVLVTLALVEDRSGPMLWGGQVSGQGEWEDTAQDQGSAHHL